MLKVRKLSALVSAVVICFVFWGCAERIMQRNETVEIVCKGDLAAISYTVKLNDGTLLYTTVSEIADNPEIRKNPWYIQSDKTGSELIVAGGENMIPGLGESVIGLEKGERTAIEIPPEQAYGTYEQDGVYCIDRFSVMPRILGLSREQFRSIISVEPVIGEEVELVPYFSSRVIQITDQEVVLESIVENDMHYDEDFGSVNVRPENDTIIIEMVPNIGASFIVNDSVGRITNVDSTSFTVDINHPLAGKPLTVDLEILSVMKASNVPESIDWMEDHDTGLSIARKQNKNVVLVLYSDGCWWCEKLMKETLTDPRIRILNNTFVWVRINTGEQTDLYDFYNQVGYPLFLILDKDGREVNRIEGFMPAYILRRELKK